MILFLLACTDTTLSKFNNPPGAQILSPADGDSALEGSQLTLRGAASDTNDATETLLVQWFADGVELCSGPPDSNGSTDCSLTVPATTVGIQLSVLDPHGEVAVDEVSLQVSPIEDNVVPVLQLTSPQEGAQFLNAENITFSATVSDTEDAAEDLMVRWESSIDGLLSETTADSSGTSTFQNSSLSVGNHLLAVTVTDTEGATAQQSLSFEVQDLPDTPPTAPTVHIAPTLPTEGDALQCIQDSPATDIDGDPISYRVEWLLNGSPFANSQTTTITGDSIDGNDTIAGDTWTCTMIPTARGSDGASAQASVSITADSACPTGNCSLRFNGVNSYVSVPDDATLDGGGRALTVEAWVWYDSVTSNCMTTVRKGTSSSATYDYWLHKNYSPGDSLFWGSWSGFTQQAFSAIVAGQWYHYAGVYTPGGNAEIYLNGALLSSNAAGTPTANNDELYIGIDWDMGCDTLGVIDEVRISDIARYTSAFAPQTTFSTDANTMALWHFDEYTGTTAHDVSGNGNDGTLHNLAWSTEHP